MMSETMSLTAFDEALDRYGPQLARWPAPARAAAERLMAADERARALHAEAARLQDLLAQAARPQPLAAPVIGRLTAALARRRRGDDDIILGLARPRAAFGLTVVAAVVFALGALTAGDIGAAADDSDIAAISLDQGGWMEEL